MVVLQANGRWLTFTNPIEEIVAYHADEVVVALARVATTTQTHYAAGFIAYEAASAFGFATHEPIDGLPLVWFGVYDEPVNSEPFSVVSGQWTGFTQSSVLNPHYFEAIARIKDEIAAGRTYQVNYTFPLQAEFSGDPQALFAQLAQNQQAEYMGYVDNGRWAIASASPELFFILDGDKLTSKPMKGTAVRGRTLAEDEQNSAWLAQDEKNRAENVMIVDMIRNDMGRVAEIGSVYVPRLFDIERYPTVLQMTSTVEATTSAPIDQILAAMFPCASITGAPKHRTMQIIKELEPQPRGVYTGAIGYIGPNRQAQFNVAIRTVLVDKLRQQATFGVGSGIVWDSDTEAEYAECQVKASVLWRQRPLFAILESLLWEPENGYFLLDYHLDRMRDSAIYFGYPWNEAEIRENLEVGDWKLGQQACKIRLLLQPDGALMIEAIPLFLQSPIPNLLSLLPIPDPQTVQVGFATEPINSDNIWLYHKTTQRGVYEQAKASCSDVDDVILWNERGEVTEASSSNIVVQMGSDWLTPPVESGLLAGTFRRWLLSNGRLREQTITIDQLKQADAIYLINSVRGWRQANLMMRDE